VRETAVGSQRFGESRPEALVLLLQFANARVGFGETAAQGGVADVLPFGNRASRRAAARFEPLDLGADMRKYWHKLHPGASNLVSTDYVGGDDVLAAQMQDHSPDWL
jgi:hypothetical protein